MEKASRDCGELRCVIYKGGMTRIYWFLTILPFIGMAFLIIRSIYVHNERAKDAVDSYNTRREDLEVNWDTFDKAQKAVK